MKLIYFLMVLSLTGCGLGRGEDGTHRGHITDVSKAGWFCKTYEGQVMTGSGNSSVKYEFTVTTEEVYAELQKVQESGAEVNLHYTSPVLYSFCRSAHEDIVDKVTEIGEN